ncbi:uncharacterized protein LOC124928304 [Impatiens glandulifera]|uniref:uncharacterized protein LOC124928304 n=1 Tax=Impatiens glandulifera TaxID=253017 RepID=UPI001FB0D25E|nr:uncharacterized protein LOC124928304 [Impatiens glandulifera]
MEEHHRTKYYCLILYLLLLIISISRLSLGREIRPTEHGLGFQNSAVEDKDSPEMRSFFGTKTAESVYPIPTHHGGGGGDSQSRLKREGLLFVATFLTGAAGAGMLIAAGLIFLFKRRWARPPSPSLEQQNKSFNS